MPAPTAPSAAPVAIPCTTRASISAATPFAAANNSMTTPCTKAATIKTGRRPMWSESLPATKRLPSSASA